LKSERIEKFKRRDYSISSLHKARICQVLLPSSVHREGMTEKEIHTKLSFLSHRTVFKLLNELIQEGKVFKSKMKYYLDLFFDDGWSAFARFLNEFLLRKYVEIPVRKIYPHGHIFPGELENEIYNFGNVIGAFIIYILIESFRPNERMIRRSYRDQIWTNFLQNAVHMPYILELFSELLSISGSVDVYKISLGGNNKSFDKVKNAYNNVYPGFSEFLDDSFRKYVVSSLVSFESCDHEWRKVNIHKIGDRFECRKCLGLVEEKDLEPETS